MNPQRVEALLKLRQTQLEGRHQDSTTKLSRPSLNSSISLKNKAIAQSLGVSKITEQEVEWEVRRLEALGHAHVEAGSRDTVEASLVLEESRLVNALPHETLYRDLVGIDEVTMVLKPRQIGKQLDPRWEMELRNKPDFDDALLCPPSTYDFSVTPQPLLAPSRRTERCTPARFAGISHTEVCLDRPLSCHHMRAVPSSLQQQFVRDARSWNAR